MSDERNRNVAATSAKPPVHEASVIANGVPGDGCIIVPSVHQTAELITPAAAKSPDN
jgi:hypothetical protein